MKTELKTKAPFPWQTSAKFILSPDAEIMKTKLLTTRYMLAVITVGLACLGFAVYNFQLEKVNFQLLILVAFTIALGSRITIEIPRFKSHIAVSDTFIFLTLLLFGGEAAIILAAVEAFCSSWRFCNKKITVFFNAAAMACSITFTVLVLRYFNLNGSIVLYEENHSNLIIATSAMAFLHFVGNAGLASVYGALKTEKPWWETFKTSYLWTSLTYFVGAIAAGILAELVLTIGFSVVIASAPVIIFLYLTYRMYLKNVEMSIRQAEQAKEYASVLETQSKALTESEERFRSAFHYAPIGIALVSPNGNWLKVNQALSQILGYSEEEFLATDFHAMIHPDDLGDALIKIHELFSGKIPACQAEQRYLSKTDDIVWVSWSVSKASVSGLEKPNLIFQIQDITDKRISEERLQYEATHDALTELPNRACFMSRLESALEKSYNNPNYKVSVLFIDLDRFKIVNDSLGHLVGDMLLIGISERLRECVRPSDTVARLGGDEFTILVEGRFEQKEVVRIAERIKDKFAIPFDLDGNEVYSSASIGILNGSEKHKKPEDLMRDADIAMYQAKRGGKDRHEIFDEDMLEDVKDSLQMETELRRAVEKDEFHVFYQPIYSLISQKIEGFEALARWNHKTLGDIPPDKFIPLAEEIGLIDMLGEQILRKSCLQMRLLKDCLPDSSSLTLSVNLSCKQFANPNLVNKIKRVLDETQFPSSKLKLEITESVFFEHKETAVEMLNQLREIGIEINIDDFGTGYSNLSCLMQLPISTLKIDRSFISPIERSGTNTEILQTIVMLARNLGMKVIAEGVETEIQLEELKKLNCEGAQGYYFAKPMSFEDMQYFLNENGITNIPESRFKDVAILSTIQ